MLQTSWNIHNTGRFVSYSLDVKILSDEVKVIIEVLRFESKSSYMILNSLKTFIIVIIIINACTTQHTHTHKQTYIYTHTQGGIYWLQK